MTTNNNAIDDVNKETDNYINYIDSFYDYCSNVDNRDFKKKADEVRKLMINDIVNSKDAISSAGTVIYVSNSGNDSFDGKTPQTPIASMERLAELSSTLTSGDAVLFERGSSFRVIKSLRYAFSAEEGVSYGAYGEGKKPCFNGSYMNYAKEEYWEETEFKNIYVLKFPIVNAGVVALDHTEEYGNYEDMVALKKMYGFCGFEKIEDLCEDCSYYNEIDDNKFYFYSSKGNPGKRFSSIEIGCRGTVILNKNAKIIDNLELKFSGYGIVGGTSINASNCIFRYIGGCMLENKKGTYTVCGNAIELCGLCDYLKVNNCWIYQMCDTALTHQFWLYEGSCVHKDISFIGNVMEYCYWSIEFNNPYPNDDSYRIVKNFRHSYNYMGMGGYGFGGKNFAREKGATLYNCFGTAKTENCICEKNILYRSSGSLYRTGKYGDRDIVYRKNINIQDKDGLLAFINFKAVSYDEEGINKLHAETIQEDSIFLNL